MGKKSSKYLTNEEREYLEWRFYNGLDINYSTDDYTDDGYIEPSYEEVAKELMEEGEEYEIIFDNYCYTNRYRVFNLKKKTPMVTNFSKTSAYFIGKQTSLNMDLLFEKVGWPTRPATEVFKEFLDRGWRWSTCYTSLPKEEQIKRVLGEFN